MNKLDGIQLIQKIRNGKVKDGSKIKVFYDDGMFDESYVTVIEYKNNDIIWAPSTFKVSMLCDSYYRFEIIEDNDKLEKIKWDEKESRTDMLRADEEIEVLAKRTETLKKKIAELVDHINKIEERLENEK